MAKKKKIDDSDLSWEMKITDTGGGGGGGRSHTLPIFKEYDRRRPKQEECNEESDEKKCPRMVYRVSLLLLGFLFPYFEF